MEQLYSNATVMWTEKDLVERDALVNQCVAAIKHIWTVRNSAVKFARVETPIITPSEYLESHVNEGFPMLQCERGYLRPETTRGCIEAFHKMFPQEKNRLRQLPFCVWQFGKSFREETNPDTMRASKLRLIEFHQLEFELFASEGSKADYILDAAKQLQFRFGGEIEEIKEDLPHYSRRTIDWHIDGLEVAGLSERTDWDGGIIYEVSIGIDRLLASTVSV